MDTNDSEMVFQPLRYLDPERADGLFPAGWDLSGLLAAEARRGESKRGQNDLPYELKTDLYKVIA